MCRSFLPGSSLVGRFKAEAANRNISRGAPRRAVLTCSPAVYCCPYSPWNVRV